VLAQMEVYHIREMREKQENGLRETAMKYESVSKRPKRSFFYFSRISFGYFGIIPLKDLVYDEVNTLSQSNLLHDRSSIRKNGFIFYNELRRNMHHRYSDIPFRTFLR